MSRQARTESGTGVYHAILRGVNKQQIFECDEDYAHFVRILRRQCGIAVSTRPSQTTKNQTNLQNVTATYMHGALWVTMFISFSRNMMKA